MPESPRVVRVNRFGFDWSGRMSIELWLYPTGGLDERRRVQRAGRRQRIAAAREEVRDRVVRQVRLEHEGPVGKQAVALVVEDLAADAPRGGRIPVEAQEVLALGLAGRLLADVVEALVDRAVGVGQRVQLQDVDADRVEPVLRDPAQHAAVLEAAARIGGAAGEAGRVVADVGEEVARVVTGLREVAGALEGGGDADALLRRLRIEPVLVLLAEEEEELRAVGVELAGDEDRSPQRVAEVPLVELRHRRVGERVARGVLARGVAVDPGVGVVLVVALEQVSRAVEVASAALGHRDHLGADGPAVLGLVVGREDLELLDGVEADRHHGAAVVAGVHVRHAVDLHVVLAGALAVGAHGLRLLSGGRGLAVHDHPGGEEGEAEEPAAVHRDVLDHLALNRVGALGALGLQLGGGRGDGDGLAQRAELEDDDTHGQAIVRVDGQRAPLGGLEAVGRDPQRVGLGRDVGEHEVPGAVDHSGQDCPAAVAHQDDGRLRYRRALRIADRAGNGRAAALGGGGYGRARDQERGHGQCREPRGPRASFHEPSLRRL